MNRYSPNLIKKGQDKEKHPAWKGGRLYWKSGKLSKKEYHRLQRKMVVAQLGGKCITCGFSDSRALQIDHINGGGSQERKKRNFVGTFEMHVLKSLLNNENKYQLLCANCNWIKRFEKKNLEILTNNKMDNNINIPKKEIAPGIFSTGGTATMPTVNPINNQPNVITSKALAPVVPIQGLPQTPVPTQPTQTTPTVSPFAGYLKDQELTQQEQQAQGLKDTGIDQYFKDLIGSQGEAQYRADEFAKTDYSANRKQLLNAENEWIRLEAEKNQDDITTARKLQQEELRDTLLPFAQMGQAKIQGDATMYRALKTAEQGVLTARQMALQGNLALASEEVERAVATKYAPFKERIATWEKMSTAIQPYLDSAEKKRLNVQNLKKDLAIKEIEKAEENEKAIEKMLLDATPNAPANIIANAKAIKDKGGSSLEVAQALGKYGGDYLKTELLKQQIVTEKAQQSNYYANASKTRKETSLLGQQVIGVDGVIATLPKSSQERYYKLQGDFDQATKNYRAAIDSAGSITALSKDATPQQQTAIIFQYMKTLDPTSTVREGEFALIGATAGLGDRAVNALKRLDNGSRLNESQIADIVGSTKVLAENAKKNLELSSNEFDRRAVKFGLPKGLFYEQQDIQATNTPADNKFGQAIGIQAPVDYTTTNMSVASDGALVWKLPANNPTK